ncbi:peptidyl-prolyl cis-trans isomerase FKBP10-like [Lytechinus pictus]|uniref:peptidyl-prolyl cis-trans isomerase FKBP10-like n=1 Tax=Lytechinus pictus TaxID=7653 RepID=UPI0030BA1B8B
MNLTLGPSLIQGFNLGLFGACIGQTRRIFVPYRLGYGDAGAGGVIPPKTDIIFLVGVLDIFKPEPTETETDYVHEVTYENTTEFVTDSNEIDDFDTGDDTNNNVIDNNHGKGDGGGSRDRNDHVRRRPHRGRSFWWYVQFLAIPVLIILLIVDAYYLYKIYFPHGRVKFYKVRDHEPNDIVNTL